MHYCVKCISPDERFCISKSSKMLCCDHVTIHVLPKCCPFRSISNRFWDKIYVFLNFPKFYFSCYCMVLFWIREKLIAPQEASRKSILTGYFYKNWNSYSLCVEIYIYIFTFLDLSQTWIVAQNVIWKKGSARDRYKRIL